jgi:hypothetical protein
MQVYGLKSMKKVLEVEIKTDIKLNSFDTIKENIFVTIIDDKMLIALYLHTRLLFYSCTKSDAQWTPTAQLQIKVDFNCYREDHLSFKDDLIFTKDTNRLKVVIDMKQMLTLGLDSISNSSPAIFAADIGRTIKCIERASSDNRKP